VKLNFGWRVFLILLPLGSTSAFAQPDQFHIAFVYPQLVCDSVSASKTYMLESDYVFQPRVFTELQHAQAIVVPYDGLNPLPPQYCYLKPHYLDPHVSYFDHVARGAL